MIKDGDKVRLKAWDGTIDGFTLWPGKMEKVAGSVVKVRAVSDVSAETVHEDEELAGWFWPLSAMEPVTDNE